MVILVFPKMYGSVSNLVMDIIFEFKALKTKYNNKLKI